MAALTLLASGSSAEDAYQQLVARGLTLARAGDNEAAGEAFTTAIASQPERPEAWTERGGLSFLQARYPLAIADLRRAVSLLEARGAEAAGGNPDEREAWHYARNLLGTALHLMGRPDEALTAWNPLGRPVVAQVRILGLNHTLDRVARREVSLNPGDLLSLREVRRTRLRLGQIGSFAAVTVRAEPRPDLPPGSADLVVALSERSGPIQSPLQAGLRHGVDLFRQRVRPRFWNLGGRGIDLRGQYRWESNRPDLSLGVDWPRPLGLPLVLHVSGFRGRQLYDLEDPLLLRSRGVALGVEKVLGSRSIAHVTLEGRRRWQLTPDRPALARPGAIPGMGTRLEHRLVTHPRATLGLAASLFVSSARLGSEVPFSRTLLAARGKALLAPSDGALLDLSALAAQVQWGRASDATPIDEMFAAGGSPDMELPLRAHPQTRDGALGRVPLGRSLTLVNLEWRQRILRRSLVQVATVALYDGAWISRGGFEPEAAGSAAFHDLGVGLRVALGGLTILRADLGRGLSDGRTAIFIGLDQVF